MSIPAGLVGSKEDENNVEEMNDGGSDDKPERVSKYGEPFRVPQVLTLFNRQNISAEF